MMTYCVLADGDQVSPIYADRAQAEADADVTRADDPSVTVTIHEEEMAPEAFAALPEFQA